MSLEDLEKQLYQKKSDDAVDLRKETSPAQKAENSGAASPAEEDSPASAKEKSAGKAAWAEAGDAAAYAENKTLGVFGAAGKVIFWVTLTAILLALGLGGFYVYQYLKTKDAVFEIKAPDKVLIGEPFEVELKLENKTQDVFRSARFAFKFPEGAAGLEKYSGRQIIEEDLGDLEAGRSASRKFKAVILPAEQTLRKFEFGYSYLPPNLNTRFEKKDTLEMAAERPAVILSLDTPEKIFSGEEFEISAEYANQTSLDFDEVKLELEYPPQFKFKEAAPAASSSGRVWSGTLSGGAKKSVAVKGAATAPDNSFLDIIGKLFVYFDGRPYLIDQKVSNLSISASPLGLSVSVNKDPNYAAVLNDTLNYSLAYKNNTDVALQDVVLKVKLTGEMFDFRSLQSTGFFDSTSNTLSWSAANAPELRSLAPSAEGHLDFILRVKPQYPIKRLFDKNFTLKAAAEINSPTVPYSISSDKTVGLASLETKVAGRAEVLISVLPTGKGVFPPRVNQAATYSVKLSIINYSTDVKEVKIKTALQSGAVWTGEVKSNIDAAPAYNSRTGEVLWQIPKIQATKGALGKPVEATFGIEITPSITQVNQQLPILGPTALSATDEFTGLKLNFQSPGIKTEPSVAP